jgi:hypothetical protein
MLRCWEHGDGADRQLRRQFKDRSGFAVGFAKDDSGGCASEVRQVLFLAHFLLEFKDDRNTRSRAC